MKRTEIADLARVHKHHRPQRTLLVSPELLEDLKESPGFEDHFTTDPLYLGPAVLVSATSHVETQHIHKVPQPAWAGGQYTWEYLVPVNHVHWSADVAREKSDAV